MKDGGIEVVEVDGITALRRARKGYIAPHRLWAGLTGRNERSAPTQLRFNAFDASACIPDDPVAPFLRRPIAFLFWQSGLVFSSVIELPSSVTLIFLL
jgi:hypothetical protein